MWLKVEPVEPHTLLLPLQKMATMWCDGQLNGEQTNDNHHVQMTLPPKQRTVLSMEIRNLNKYTPIFVDVGYRPTYF